MRSPGRAARSRMRASRSPALRTRAMRPRPGRGRARAPGGFVRGSLADAPARRSGSLGDARIRIPSASAARDALAAGLQKHAPSPESIPVYRTLPAKTDLRGLAEDIKVG